MIQSTKKEVFMIYAKMSQKEIFDDFLGFGWLDYFHNAYFDSHIRF